MAKKSGRKKGGSRRRTRRGAGSSSGGCVKTVDRCGMSATVCDDSNLQNALKEARQGQRNVHQWAKAIAKEESANAGRQIKAIQQQLIAFNRAKKDALKSCRKTISVADHMRAANSAGRSYPAMARFGRVRRSRR